MSSSPGLCVPPILRCSTSLLVSLLLLSRCCESVLDIKAKLMDERRVVGQGYSVLASSLDQCLALCNKDPGNCDGVNYRETKNKCRLLARCANTTVLPDTRGFLYYSKRPRGSVL
ncbi:unnamed protein product [Timema podura]|uniref:Apple domain-containing protein n=1 Tax=Timema podura TaxID=61482 RepID=A0ABN7NGM7_TIMPD|nr:unnamed protein product [Timema podura]